MGIFKLGNMTMGSLFTKAETIRYPAEKPTYYPATRGKVDNAIDECISCGICQKRCPTQSITVDRKAKTWTIDWFRCVKCGECIRSCPQHCLYMEQMYVPVAHQKSLQTRVQSPDADPRGKKKAAAKAAAAKSGETGTQTAGKTESNGK
jgi:ech hydrogenase subunit F